MEGQISDYVFMILDYIKKWINYNFSYIISGLKK